MLLVQGKISNGNQPQRTVMYNNYLLPILLRAFGKLKSFFRSAGSVEL